MSDTNASVDATVSTHEYSVMCIDDNTTLIDALERRLSSEPGFTFMHRPTSVASSVADVVRITPTVVLLDVNLPGGVDALSILAGISARAPLVRVVLFTGSPSAALVADAMQRGAWGVLCKGISTARLLSAIRRVVRGEAVVDIVD